MELVRSVRRLTTMTATDCIPIACGEVLFGSDWHYVIVNVARRTEYIISLDFFFLELLERI